jgi:hypothetical protein
MVDEPLAGWAFGAVGFAGLVPAEAAGGGEHARHRRLDDGGQIIFAGPKVGEDREAVAGAEIDRDLEPGDLADVEIGLDDPPLQPRLALQPDLDIVLPEEGDDEFPVRAIAVGGIIAVLRHCGRRRGELPARGAAPGETGAASFAGGLAMGGGEEVVGAADALLLLVYLQRLVAGGEEALIVPGLAELGDSELGSPDDRRGLTLGPGDGKGGDVGALDLRGPAVGPGDAARHRLEIEQIAEAGELRELRLAGEAFGAAAVAEDGEGVGSGHGQRNILRTGSALQLLFGPFRESARRGLGKKKGRRMKRIAWAAALLVAGCGGAGPGGQGNEAAPAVNSAAAAPASAPKAEAPAPPAVAVLTAEGFGPLRIGMSRAEVVGALGEDSDPEAVGGPDPESCDSFRPVRAPEGLLVMIEEGRLTSISLIDDSRVETDRGLRLGATAASVRAAYGAALQAGPHKYEEAPAEYLTVWAKDGPRADAHETAATARGIRYEIGGKGVVQAIHAGGPSIEYVEGCA